MTTLTRNTTATRLPFGLGELIAEASPLRAYIALAIVAIGISYGTYLAFDVRGIMLLGREDGVFEWVTVVFFLVAAALFFFAWRESGNAFYLLLALAFFVGAGEEISWGQRLIGFGTPQALATVNAQQEFNLHNLAVLNPRDMSGEYKHGLARLLTVNFLYKLFWLGFGVLIPLAVRASALAAFLARRFQFPVAALPIGLLFIVNWLAYKATLSLLARGQDEHYYAAAMEMQEALSALVFTLLGFWFLQAELRKPR
jgi:hypothetical protein